MEITGHETREMFDRYNTVDNIDKKQGLDQLKLFLGGRIGENGFEVTTMLPKA
jgi:hypothetical protein